MPNPFNREEVAYLVAATPAKARVFAYKHALPHFVAVRCIEDVPRKVGINVVLIGKDCHQHPDYECLFCGGYMEQFKANVYYDHEVV